MAITLVPSQGISATNAPLSVGWPLRYRVQNATAASGKTQISCAVRVLSSIIIVAEFEVSPLFGATSPQATYEVDIQQAASDWFKRFGFQVLLPHFNQTGVYTRDEFYFTDFTVQFRFWERDNATGVISQRPDLFTDTISVVFNTPQYEQSLDLRPYLMQVTPVGVFSNNYKRFVQLRRNDIHFLTFLRRQTLNNVLIEYLHRAPNGTRTQVGLIPIPDPLVLDFLIVQNTISIGLPTLQFATYSVGAYSPPPAGWGYSIRLARGTTAPYLPVSEFVDFELRDRCAGTIRVWWLNMRGGIDAYNFYNKSEQKISTGNSAIGQRPILWQPSGNPREALYPQQFRTDPKAEYEIVLESEPLEERDLIQIQDVLYSTAIFARIENFGIVPCYLKSGEVTPNAYLDYDKQTIRLTLSLANPRITLMP